MPTIPQGKEGHVSLQLWPSVGGDSGGRVACGICSFAVVNTFGGLKGYVLGKTMSRKNTPPCRSQVPNMQSHRQGDQLCRDATGYTRFASSWSGATRTAYALLDGPMIIETHSYKLSPFGPALRDQEERKGQQGARRRQGKEGR